MSVVCSYNLSMAVQETLESGVDGASNPVITHAALDVSGTLRSSTTVPATKCSFDSVPLVAGAATIDLTALPMTANSATTFDATGLKVQVIRLENPSTNANNITFAEGASNGYSLWGSAWAITLKPGQAVMYYGADGTPDVAAGDKTIDVTGTLVQPFKMSIVLG